MVEHVTPRCPMCGKTQTIELTDDEAVQLVRWQCKELLIQNAFPDWLPDKREMLMTGIHPKCWDELFKKEDV